MAQDYDLFVIGAGSGGVRASRVAARLGARVALAEDRKLGGTCVNEGCIPKKLLVYAAHFADAFEDAAGFGWELGPRRFHWSRLRERKDREIRRLNALYAQLLQEAGVQQISGRARLAGPNQVQVDGQTFRASHILVATGSWPHLPEKPGIQHAISSNEAFHLEQLPERVLIVGGGYIAVEFAGIFRGLGCQVTLAYRGPLFLRGFDDDLRRYLAQELAKRAVDLRFCCEVEAIERRGAELRVALSGGETLEVQQVLFATGRVPKTRDLGLEEVGVELGSRGEIQVDAYSRSSVPSIWAVGDVTDRINLTPVAIAEGEAFAHTAFGSTPIRPDHTGVPSAVFSQPPIGSCGLTETRARQELEQVDVYRSRFRPLKHTLSGRDEQSLMKLVVEAASGRVAGCHIAGPDAPEILQAVAIAMKCGATKAQFDATVGIHPTSAEELVTLREPVGASA